MSDTKREETCAIYYRPLKKKIEVTQQQKDDWDRLTDATIKRQQRAGLCCVPQQWHFLCDGHCYECKFSCNSTGVFTLSIEREISDAYHSGACNNFLASPNTFSEIDLNSVILRQIFAELRLSEPEHYHILCYELAGLSERDAAELLHLSRKAYVYRRDKLFLRLKKYF